MRAGLAGMLAAVAAFGVPSSEQPAPAFPRYRSGARHAGNNKPMRDYDREKRRRQIARASRQLNRRRP